MALQVVWIGQLSGARLPVSNRLINFNKWLCRDSANASQLLMHFFK